VNNTLLNIRKAGLEAPADQGIKIVGIDGPSGSGKSTLAEKLSAL
jgi:uridine kinase